jgi:hypothetical protein
MMRARNACIRARDLLPRSDGPVSNLLRKAITRTGGMRMARHPSRCCPARRSDGPARTAVIFPCAAPGHNQQTESLRVEISAPDRGFAPVVTLVAEYNQRCLMAEAQPATSDYVIVPSARPILLRNQGLPSAQTVNAVVREAAGQRQGRSIVNKSSPRLDVFTDVGCIAVPASVSMRAETRADSVALQYRLSANSMRERIVSMILKMSVVTFTENGL